MKEYKIPYLSQFDDWEQVEAMTDFSYPWRNDNPPATSFQAYHNGRNLYFRFVAMGPTPKVYVDCDDKLEVIHSERVEIFFKKDDALNPYYCFEIDPHGRVLDYEATHYRQFNRDWEWPGNMNIETTSYSAAYVVSGKFELTLLYKMGLLKGNILEAGLYRGHCTALVENQATLKWISWIKPESKEPDFHIPSSFGKLILEPIPQNEN